MNETPINFQRALDDYIQYFEKLNARSIRLIEKIAAPGIRFKDPFNDVQGVDAFERIFEHMFANIDSPKFEVQDYAWGKEGHTAYLRWVLHYKLKGQSRRIDGMSEVMFSKDGKLMSHIDHWDAGEQFYEHIPVLGALIRFVKSKLEI
ncbi:MAG: nuclear transport factor 2 family protein [Pseudomonadota bacterium]